MDEISQEQQLVRRYLLGLAGPEDSRLIEERLLTEESFCQQLQIAEDQLLDDYLSSTLSAPERQSLEGHFLQAPERRQKLRFARAFRRYVDLSAKAEEPQDVPLDEFAPDEPSPLKPPAAKLFSFPSFGNPLVSGALIAAMLLIVGFVSWTVSNNWRQQTRPQSGEVLAVVLRPGLTRDSGETRRVAISPQTGTVRLQLQMAAAEYTSYRVVVLSVEQAEVWNATNLPAQDQSGTKVVTADVPANALSFGDYQIKLSGQLADGKFEDIAVYSLRITR